jgi:hypothetical protein
MIRRPGRAGPVPTAGTGDNAMVRVATTEAAGAAPGLGAGRWPDVGADRIPAHGPEYGRWARSAARSSPPGCAATRWPD